MSFSFGGQTLPVTVRLCRSFLWAQATLTILGGTFILLVATLFGSSDAIPFHNQVLTGNQALVLGVVYLAVGGTLVWCGVALGRLAPWARTLIICMQVLVVAIALFRSTDITLSLVINVALCVTIIALLFTPDAHRALEGVPQA